MADTLICRNCGGIGDLYVDRSFIEPPIYPSGFERCRSCYGKGYTLPRDTLIQPGATLIVYEAIIDACVKAIETKFGKLELEKDEEHA